jgi:ribonucleoside-triphosphate reductase
MYGKAVTLLKTHWPEVNEVMQRNRRIGCSVSGVAQFVESRGYNELSRWLDAGYQEIVKRDKQYSEWLGVRESIKKTSVKPSGTVSLLAGATPRAHWPIDEIYIRRVRFSEGSSMLQILEEAGYYVEPSVYENGSMIVELPAQGPSVRTQDQVSIWEKAELAATLQRYWADNQVSVTITFRKDEADQIGHLIKAKEGQLKSVSFLKDDDESQAYAQAPYERISETEYQNRIEDLKKIPYTGIYRGKLETEDAVGDKYCSNDTCEIPIN